MDVSDKNNPVTEYAVIECDLKTEKKILTVRSDQLKGFRLDTYTKRLVASTRLGIKESDIFVLQIKK